MGSVLLREVIYAFGREGTGKSPVILRWHNRHRPFSSRQNLVAGKIAEIAGLVNAETGFPQPVDRAKL
tara:strand:- start:1956 stop:2159 length:204 start_codon:yes stop_codon:yes gene_type:complete